MKRALPASIASLSAICAMGLALAGCGYHFAAAGSGLPSAAKTIYVAHFRNGSRDSSAADQFDRVLKDEIARHKRLELVEEPAAADLVLDGTIRGVESFPAGFNQVFEPSLYNYNLTVDARLLDNRTSKTVWQGRGLSAQQQYGVVQQGVVVGSPQFLQQNLRSRDIAKLPDAQVAQTELAASQQDVMDTLAHDVYAAMSEGF